MEKKTGFLRYALEEPFGSPRNLLLTFFSLEENPKNTTNSSFPSGTLEKNVKDSL